MKGATTAMGNRLTGERGPRAWSRLTQSQVVRHGVRALVFAGAVGAAWLIGSSSDTAHAGTGPEQAMPRSEAAVGIERTADAGADPQSPYGCTDRPSEWLPADAGDRTSAVRRKITRLEPAPAKPTGATSDAVGDCESATAVRAPAPTVAPDPQAQPRSPHRQLEEFEGTAYPRSALQPLSPPSGETRTVSGPRDQAAPGHDGSSAPLTHAARPVTGGEVTAPVNHTVGGTTDPVVVPFAGGAGSFDSTADGVTTPVTGALADTTRPVTDELTDGVLPRLEGPVNRLVPSPVAGLPSGETPTPPAPPVAPGVDQTIGTTSTVGLDDVLPDAAHRTGKGATTAPSAPAPAPLPAVPGTGVTTGSTSSSYTSIPGGGASATIPASPVQSEPGLGTLLATAFDAALRDLAGEPAVSPD